MHRWMRCLVWRHDPHGARCACVCPRAACMRAGDAHHFIDVGLVPFADLCDVREEALAVFADRLQGGFGDAVRVGEEPDAVAVDEED